MRHAPRGLEEHQARVGIETVNAPTLGVAREALEVQFRQVATQAEPEPVLARGGPLAGPGIATGLGENGQNLVAKADGRLASACPTGHAENHHQGRGAARHHSVSPKGSWREDGGRESTNASLHGSPRVAILAS